MTLACTGRNIVVTPALRQLAEQRTGRLERHVGGPAVVRVILSREKHRFGAEVIATQGRRSWKAQEEKGDPRAALALAFAKIDAQAAHDTEKRRDRKHKEAARRLSKGLRAAQAETAPAAAPRSGVRIVRARPSTIKPMGVDEAALVMESSGQEVLVFRDASNERVSVLYRRRDGDLGLIVPEC